MDINDTIKERLKSYQTFVEGISIYRESSIKNTWGPVWMYPVLGLCGESSELFLAKDRDEIIKECGDVLWYVAAIANELKIDLSKEFVLDRELEFSIILPEYYVLSSLMAFSGALAEMSKKTLRDHGSNWSEDRSVKVKTLLNKIIQTAVLVAHKHHTSLIDIINANQEKLSSRRDREKLHGEGDNR